MKKYLTSIAAIAAFSASSFAQTALDGVISSDTTLSAGTDYLLTGVHYVAPGATLTIEPGVTVYAEEIANASDAPALIVAAGAMIDAVGTAENPIVFTSVKAMSEELDHNDVGLWSGVIVLGNATINSDMNDIASDGSVVLENSIEGLSAVGRHGLDQAVEAEYLTYGGDDDSDSSGNIEYVSIRHTGFSISGVAGDEIQGLTLGGVGDETIIENVEVFVSDDDGIEIFGGTVNLKNIVLAYAEDDSLDVDQGYRGKVQNLLVMQVDFTDESGESRDGDHGGEWDGADSQEANTPSAQLKVANATFIQGAEVDGNNDDVIRVRNAGRAQVYNSVAVTNDSQFIRLDNNDEGYNNTIVEDAVTAGDTAFMGNIFWNGDSSTALDSDTVSIKDFADEVAALATITDAAANNNVLDPEVDVVVAAGGKITVTIPATGALYDLANGVDIPEDDFLMNTEYIGAFNGSNWADWTFVSQEGYLVVEEDSSEPLGNTYDDIYGNVYVYGPSIEEGVWLWQYNTQGFIYVASQELGGDWAWFSK